MPISTDIGRVVSSLVTEATAEPLTVAQAKEFTRIDTTAEDVTLIPILITACRKAVESFTGRILLKQTWQDCWDVIREQPRYDGKIVSYMPTFDGNLPRVIHLQHGPLMPTPNLTIYTTDINNVETTYSSTNYTVDANSWKPRIWLNTNATWPATRDLQAIRIVYDAGYDASDATKIPAPLVMAVRQLFATYYEQREQIQEGSPAIDISHNFNVGALLAPYRDVRI